MRHSCSSSQTSLHYNLTNNRLCLFIKLLISLKIASSKLKIHLKKKQSSAERSSLWLLYCGESLWKLFPSTQIWWANIHSVQKSNEATPVKTRSSLGVTTNRMGNAHSCPAKVEPEFLGRSEGESRVLFPQTECGQTGKVKTQWITLVAIGGLFLKLRFFFLTYTFTATVSMVQCT